MVFNDIQEETLYALPINRGPCCKFDQLIISSWHSYRTKPWKIYGPKGTKKFFIKNLI